MLNHKSVGLISTSFSKNLHNEVSQHQENIHDTVKQHKGRVVVWSGIHVCDGNTEQTIADEGYCLQ